MKCPKCDHSLPADSEFCQYCGNRIEQPVTPPVTEKKEEPTQLPDSDKITPDEALNALLQVQAKNTVAAMEANSKTQPVVAAQVPQSGKPVKTKYCSRCGSAIDNKTKKCTGCGKQYFRGLKFTKFSVTVIILALVIAVLATVCVLQFLNGQTMDSAHRTQIDKLESEISSLEQQVKNKESTIKTKDATIKRLEGEIDDLEEEKWDNWAKLLFYDSSVVIIGDDGSKTYHKYGCSKLDTSNGYWILNEEATDYYGYKKCTKCND